MITPKSGTNLLRRRAAEVRRYRIWKRVLPAIIGSLAVLLTLVYVVSVMYTRFGIFSISVNKYHALKYGLSLSESPVFDRATSRLDCRASEEITNIDGAELDKIDFGAVDGNDSGENYLCYTFYCKNTGEETISFQYGIHLANMTMGIEKAVRIRLITSIDSGERLQRDYARAAGTDDDTFDAVAEEGTIPFYSKTTAMQDTVDSFEPGSMMKCTVVIWLEGNDKECVDSIIGGMLKVDMKFEVTAVGGVAVDL